MRIAPVIAAVVLGIFVGVSTLTFRTAKGLSYLSEDPRTCVNCHIMRSEYDGWQKASHHTVATCNDCHLPHDYFGKYLAKARNGWNHSKAFTLQDFPEPIRITPPNAAILQANCERCHDALLHDATVVQGAPTCVHCHDDVGHGETAGLGGPSTPEHP